MEPKFNYNNLIIFFLISIYPPGFSGQADQNAGSCGQPYQCADKADVTYPFSDMRSRARPDRFTLCGHPDFRLNCNGEKPILNISNLSYRVLEIDYSNFSLKVARQDLWNNPCHPIPLDTQLSNHFEVLWDSGYKNVSLYYNCTAQLPKTLPNQFSCGSSKTTDFFDDGAGNFPTAELGCSRKIIVPMSETVLEDPTVSSPILAASTSGFMMKWSADNSICTQCNRVGGTCVYAVGTRSCTCRFRSKIPRSATPRDVTANPNPFIDVSPNTTVDHPAGSPSNASSMPPIKPKDRVSNSTRLKLGVGFGVVGFALVIVFISWLCKRQHCPSAPPNPNIEKFLDQHGSLAPKRYRYSEIKKMTKSFNDKLGQGGYGSVYKGLMPDGSLVAIKLLFEMDSNDEEFINEVASISRTSHVNIVSLLGFCYEKNKRALVYEYMPNSLDKFIRNATNTSQDVEILYNIVVGIAKGLEYLHSGCSTRIIHFDIKPQNILLDEGFSPKIADFGLAKLCKKRQSILSVPGTRGTVGYIAPEVFSRNFGGVSHKSDVYSYGIMILEMAGSKKYVQADTRYELSENYFPDKIYEQVIELGHATKNVDYNECLIEHDDERVIKMLLVGFWCMQTMPSDRPPMSKVLEMLEGNLKSIPIPPKPFLFNPNITGQEISPFTGHPSLTTTSYSIMTTSREEDA